MNDLEYIKDTYLKEYKCDSCDNRTLVLGVGGTSCGNTYSYLCINCINKVFDLHIKERPKKVIEARNI